MEELGEKLATIRTVLLASGLSAVRLKGVDWFAWATCGGSSAVLLAAEAGVAEVLVTRGAAWVLTDVIERDRLGAEELPRGYQVKAWAWTDPSAREAFVRDAAEGGTVASDRPAGEELGLPAALVRARWSLLAPEIERYRALGRDAACAMTDVLFGARPEWTGFELAGAACEALWKRGLEPLLTLVGDERRLPIYRHATASRDKLGARAMLVFCARRHGLFANLTRFVYFRPPSRAERKLVDDVARIEADALSACVPGATLGAIYQALVSAYARAGHPGGDALHHQGGPCGYLSRDAVARPGMAEALEENNALAINPSLPGAKIEDTLIVRSGAEPIIVTADERWPTVQVAGRPRPDLLLR